MPPDLEAKNCQWINEASALKAFAEFDGKTQSAKHIKPLHWYVACRLVIEGGFDPDDIVPRPPFRAQQRGKKAPFLHFDASLGEGGERTVLGGLKTKNVDVVVSLDGIGPVLAVSCKGVTGAFRNLTNRMEETIGECTNLHITYPALALGYLVLLRANRQPDLLESSNTLTSNDIALTDEDKPVAAIERFHNALCELVGRQGIRNDVSRYESIGFGLVEMQGGHKLQIGFPPQESSLHFNSFFNTLYIRYDERFVVGAPDLKSVTRRYEWDSKSPAFNLEGLDYLPRVSS